MTTCSCCVQRSPQLVVLRVDIGPMVEEKLDYLFIVVYAALVRKRCRQIGVFLNFGKMRLIPAQLYQGTCILRPPLYGSVWQQTSPPELKTSWSRAGQKAPCRTPTLGRLKVTVIYRVFWFGDRTRREQ